MTVSGFRISVVGVFVSLGVVTSCSEAEIAAEDDRVADVEQMRATLKPIADAQCKWMFTCCNENIRALEIGEFVSNASECSERLLDMAERGIFSGPNYYSAVPSVLQALAPLGYGFE